VGPPQRIVSDDAARVAELLGVLPEVPPLVHGPEPATPSSRPCAVAVRSLSQADAGNPLGTRSGQRSSAQSAQLLRREWG